MSFKLVNIFYSLISIIIALFFIFIGVISFMLPWFPGARLMLATFIMEDSVMIFLFGFCFLMIGAAFIAGTIWTSQRKYYRLKTGPYGIDISETLFHDYLMNYWKKVFPHSEIPCTVKVAKNRIHVTADLPFVPMKEQKEFLEKMQYDVTHIFSRLLGYQAEYHFAISFKDEK